MYKFLGILIVLLVGFYANVLFASSSISNSSILTMKSEISYTQSEIPGIESSFASIIKALIKGLGDLWDFLLKLLDNIIIGISEFVHKSVQHVRPTEESLKKDFMTDPSLLKTLDDSNSKYALSLKSIDELNTHMLEEVKVIRSSRIAIFYSMPIDITSYSKIFPNDDLPSSDIIDGVNSVTSHINGLKQKYINNVEDAVLGTSREDFANYLSNIESEYVAVIGHNESGNFALIFPPPMQLSKMAAMCRQAKKQCIFLSCESQKYIDAYDSSVGVTSPISYGDAYYIMKSIVEVTKNKNNLSLQELDAVIQRKVLYGKYKPVVRFVVVSSGFMTGLSGLAVSLKEEPAEGERTTKR